MKLILSAFIISLLTFSAMAESNTTTNQETSAQTKCGVVFRKVIRKQSIASMALLDKLLADGRITNDDLTEFDRITKPAVKIANLLHSTCLDDSLDLEQVDMIEKTLL